MMTALSRWVIGAASSVMSPGGSLPLHQSAPRPVYRLTAHQVQESFPGCWTSVLPVDGQAGNLVPCDLCPVQNPAVGFALVVGGQHQVFLAVGTDGDGQTMSG